MVSYRKNGALAVISDMAVYGIGSDGSELWNYPLENTIDQAALGNKEYIVLALGDSMADKDGRAKGTVCWLDGSGKEKASFETGESVTYLLSSEKGVVIGNDRSYTGVTHSGSENWNYIATADMNDLIPMEKLNRVMAVGKEQVSIYDMTKAQSGETTAKPTENPQTENASEEKTVENNTSAGDQKETGDGEKAEPSVENEE